ncbi:hypothetical protein [Variovorax sp. PBL-E5]|uniref:hypothetical protein n=1 Tax=Variovorax sp. PBL-E5 TaxID=434014 RepID=UPI001316C323|nr:hypothetical protein [Variovorax sp. PBL-E5]VTU39711.1 hypothetical protein E5CHR_05179 [Variovorax sp. PBL-E5]
MPEVRNASDNQPGGQVILLTAAAMLAFATNSLLCRLAPQQRGIDPARGCAGLRR